MYVTKADYKNRIATDLLNIVITEGENNGDDILATVSQIAENTISTFAGVLYDLSGELAKATTERNYFILSWALSIATYEIYQRIPDESVPDKVIKNYNDTMDALERCANGKLALQLPAVTVNDGTPENEGTGENETVNADGQGLRRIGSAAKRSHRI